MFIGKLRVQIHENALIRGCPFRFPLAVAKGHNLRGKFLFQCVALLFRIAFLIDTDPSTRMRRSHPLKKKKVKYERFYGTDGQKLWKFLMTWRKRSGNN